MKKVGIKIEDIKSNRRTMSDQLIEIMTLEEKEIKTLIKKGIPLGQICDILNKSYESQLKEEDTFIVKENKTVKRKPKLQVRNIQKHFGIKPKKRDTKK